MLRQLFAAVLTLVSISASSILEQFPIPKLEGYRFVETFTINSCKGNCENFNSQTLDKLTGVILETDKGTVYVEHGFPFEYTPVPANAILLTCFCSQLECRVPTPAQEQAILFRGNKVYFYVPNKILPSLERINFKEAQYTEQEIKQIDKRNQEAFENI